MVHIPEGHIRKRKEQEREAREKGNVKEANRISLDCRIIGTLRVQLQQCLEENDRLRAGLRQIATGVDDPVQEAQRLLSGFVSTVVTK